MAWDMLWLLKTNLSGFKNPRLGVSVAMFFGYLIHFILMGLVKLQGKGDKEQFEAL